MAGMSAYGTSLKIGGTAGTAVVNVTNFNGPNMSADQIDVSAHDTGNWRNYVAGPLDGGELTLDLNLDLGTATHGSAAGGLLNYFTNRTSSSYALTFPDSSGFTFTASVTGYTAGAQFDDKLTGTVTLKISGAVTPF